jgi:hypothetical protein
VVREVTVLYFDEAGRKNTDLILGAALRRAVALGVEHVVVASNTGATGRRALELARELGFDGHLVVVAEHCGFREPGVQLMPSEVRRELEAGGARVVVGTHALSSISRSYRMKWGGMDMLETIAEAYRRVSQGFKVCVEISLMAADAGEIPVDRDVVAVGGSGGGADSSIVLRAANQNRFFDLKVREVIGMPR